MSSKATSLWMFAVSLLALAGWADPAMALKCQTSSGTCYDTKTKEYRKCTTKVCTDDKGTVISTETVLELKGGGSGKPKSTNVLPKASGAGAAKE